MGLTFRLSKFLKKNFTYHEEEPSSTPSSRPVSTYMSPVTSPTASIYEYQVSEKYLRDPMRCNNRPDVVGFYVDPMGGRISHCHGNDPTNTGA
ncbi:hypothetical protein DFQ28_008586 [Apophysomyces sp. BC1034]|nr:hypothetical protein DFQ30_000290 [Apophysomyces sp. BC1015]KAG0181003.1 hypothetical protein DFQ29_009611 [Apophysomyces sp. BC1021]KAG0192588.1 hypothetical protein DFQ28_008586 [Apophysomyces sp. BC1034]